MGGALAVILFLLTVLETDAGWEDAIWRYPSTAKTIAWVAVGCAALGSLAGVVFAEWPRLGGDNPLWLRLLVAVEMVALGSWVAAAYTAPS